MSEFIAQSRACSSIVASLAITAAIHLSSAAAQSPGSDPNLQLIGSLKSAVEAIESLPAFDVAGVTIHAKDFGDEKRPVVETNRFRMQVDHDREVLRYVVEIRRSKPPSAGDVEAGDPITSSFLITGNTVQRRNAVNGIEQLATAVEYQSFKEALASGGAPAPGFWGIRDLPLYPDHLKRLDSWIESISEGSAKVTTATPGNDTIRYTVRIEEEPEGVRFSNLHWSFKLPKHRPTFFKVEKGANEGEPVTIGEHNVDYAVIHGHEVPIVIRSWSLSVKRKPDGLLFGKTHRVTNLKWLKIDDGAVDEAPKHLTTPEEIGSFLDEAPPTLPIDIDAQ